MRVGLCFIDIYLLIEPFESIDRAIPLCLNCYTKYRQNIVAALAEEERMINFLNDEMESIAGVPISSPRFPERKVVKINEVKMNNFNIKDSTIGVINSGNVQTIDSSITVLKNDGDVDIANAIMEVTKQVLVSNELNDSLKDQIIELLSEISINSLADKSKRKKSVVSAIIEKISSYLTSAEKLTNIWEKYSPLFKKWFDIGD